MVCLQTSTSALASLPPVLPDDADVSSVSANPEAENAEIIDVCMGRLQDITIFYFSFPHVNETKNII